MLKTLSSALVKEKFNDGAYRTTKEMAIVLSRLIAPEIGTRKAHVRTSAACLSKMSLEQQQLLGIATLVGRIMGTFKRDGVVESRIRANTRLLEYRFLPEAERKPIKRYGKRKAKK